jgi:DNA-binding transcriptional LysR family regulator
MEGTDRPLGFEPRHLAALVAIAKTGSFRIAGEHLGYVQSAVSRPIATLEEVAGARLVERARGANDVTLTPAGELLVRHAEALLARQAIAHADLAQLAQGELGPVRIGVPQGVGHRLLRPALAAFRRRRPRARVLPSEYPGDAAPLRLLEQGALDLCVARLPVAGRPFASHELLRVRWVLALPAAWALAPAGGRIALAELADRPLIGRHDAHVGPPLEAELRALGIEPQIAFRTDIDETIRALVAAGMGAAALPAFSVDEHDPAITAVTVEDLPLAEMVGLLWHHERVLSAGAATLRDVMREVCGRLDGERARVRARAA